MQICIIALGILLVGQIDDAGGVRHSGAGSAALANGGVEDKARPPATQPRADLSLVATAPARLTKVARPAELLARLSKQVGIEKLVGVQLSLAEAVQNASSRAEQTRRVGLYWELSQAVTNFHLASLEELELQSLLNGLGGNNLGQASQVWEVALQAVSARKQVARSAVKVAQLCLHQELGRVSESNFPLPSDLPHCGAYQTKYEQIFQGRTSREAKQLGELLPLRYKELRQRASEAAAAREWLILVSQQRSPQSDGTQLLKAYEILALQRQTFVATAYQYNENIARYTELAVPQEIGTMRLVAMLIQTKGNSGVEWQRGAIQRATAEEAVPQNNAERYQPRSTYAEPGRSETRRVPAGEVKGERSILVTPKKAEQ